MFDFYVMNRKIISDFYGYCDVIELCFSSRSIELELMFRKKFDGVELTLIIIHHFALNKQKFRFMPKKMEICFGRKIFLKSGEMILNQELSPNLNLMFFWMPNNIKSCQNTFKKKKSFIQYRLVFRLIQWTAATFEYCCNAHWFLC